MHPSHLEELLEIKKTFFTEISEAAELIKNDHLEFFVMKLEPIDDDLESTIEGYKSVKLEGEKYDKVNKNILKIIDTLQRRKRAYDLFLKNKNV